MECPAAVGVDDPVEDNGEEEEGEGVEDLVVDVGPDLKRCEAGVACEEEQQEEDSCRIVSVCLEAAGQEPAPGRHWSARGREVERGGELLRAELQLHTNLRMEVVSSCLRGIYVDERIINDLRR